MNENQAPKNSSESAGTGRRRRRLGAGIVAALLVLAAVFAWQAQRQNDPTRHGRKVSQQPSQPLEQLVPQQVTGGEFASSSSCRECHPDEHGSWSRTYHRSMTQLATPQTVLADFHDVELDARGRWYRLQQDGEAFSVTMRDPKWEANQRALGNDPSTVATPPTVTRPIVMTTGSHHMQGYWFPAGQGRELLQLPFYYHLADRRWMPREDVFLRPADNDPSLANWSMVCIKCHSVAGVPGGDPTQTAMDSRVAELGIACEACHGPGTEHVARRRAVAGRSPPPASSDPIVNPKRLDAQKQAEICGQCHSEFFPANPLAFWEHGLGYRAGQALERTHVVVKHNGPLYQEFKNKFEHTFWNDGTCRVGGDEFNALVASPCYERGTLSCLSCHSMHSAAPDDLLADGMRTNAACQQCHEEPRFNAELDEHTHHAASSSGSLCYNCHMPHTTYALMTAMRSHRVTSPRVMSISGGNPPNACNLCHLDQTLGWTSKYLSRWYRQPPVTLRGDELQVAASLLGLLRGDAMQRAISAWHMGWPPALATSGDQWQAPFLSRLLADPYAGVRYQAVKALQRQPGLADFEADFIGPLADRRQAGQQAVSKWVELRGKTPPDNFRHLILDEQFDVRETLLERLIEQRDDRPVRIPE